MNALSLTNKLSPASLGGAFFCAWLVVITAGSLGGCAAEAGRTVGVPVPGGAVMESTRVMIGPADLQLMLGDPRLVLLHVGHGDKGYHRGHIPGARYVDFTEIMALERDGRKTELLTPEAFETLMRRLGIDAESRVVLYGDAAGVFPARLYVTMRHFGLGENARLLDGHLRGWVAQGRIVAATPGLADGSGPPAAEPGHAVEGKPWRPTVTPGVVVGDEDVRRAVAGQRATLLDVRPADQFSGQKKGPGVKVAGRIATAKNLPWREMVAGVKPPWLRPEAELRGALADAGVPQGRPVIVYDAAGMHASLAYAVLLELGYDVSLYDGGYAAWSAGASAEPAK
ncbi:MAG: rhodanese-like domain-containing protein [Planctomycetota bacterium]